MKQKFYYGYIYDRVNSARKRKLVLIILSLLGIITSTALLKHISYSTSGDNVKEVQPEQKIMEIKTNKERTPVDMDSIISGRIKFGQSYYSLMMEYGINRKESNSFYQRYKELKCPIFMPGDSFVITKRKDTLRSFSLRTPRRVWYYVEQNGDSIRAAKREPSFHAKISQVSGVLVGDLYTSILKLGQKPELVIRFADIFAWDINFFSDPRQGDTFAIVFEKLYDDNEFVKYGKILAARYKTSSSEYKALLFPADNEHEAYYDEEGRAVQKMFLKAPLNYTRISSRFSLRRYHPILHIYRRHPAVDYAAPTGTPVYAAASGRIEYAKRCGGYGKSVCIQHGNGYKTYYGHLSRYGPNIKKGKMVNQKDCIGYVGKTGLATGPHLDYRIKKHGSYINPLKIKSPESAAVPEKDRAAFEKMKQLRIKQLNGDIDNTPVVSSVRQ